MATKPIVMAVAAVVVFGGALAVASQVGLPPVSKGGEFAYVRDFPADGLETAASGEHLTATYVGLSLDDHPVKDRVLRFESRGRIADTELFHRMDVPDQTFSNLSFVAVDHVERGILLGEGPAACAAFLNGVNAGTLVVAKSDIETRYLATGEFDISQDGDAVLVERDGHTYRLETSGGNLSVDGGNIRADLPAGSELRGWIDREYPATTKVMHASFDDLSADCAGTAEEPVQEAPGNETEPSGNETAGNETQEPANETQEPTYGPDAAVEKSVVAQDEETVTFGIVTENLGDWPVRNVTMTDPLPDVEGQWFLGGADSEHCELSGDDLTCRFGTLDPGVGRSVTVRGYVRDMCGELSNTAFVSGDQDQDSSNDDHTAVADLGPCGSADVGVNKSVVDQDEETVTFGMVVSSVGELDAHDVVLRDDLPPVNGTWFLGGADADQCSIDGDSLTCDFGTVASGEGREVTARGYVRDMCGELSNTAFVSASEDSNPSNDDSTAVADLGPCATPDVGVEKVVAGQDAETVTFGMTVTSVGELDAEETFLSDQLPAVNGTWFLGGADADACTIDGDTLTCEFGTLAPGESRYVEARGYVRDRCGDLSNTAVVSAVGDGNPSNDESTAVADLGPCDEPEPEPQPDAGVEKTAVQDDTAVEFTITTSSVGDATVHGVEMMDMLPDINRTWYLGGADSEFCSLSGTELVCTFGDLAPGESRTVTVKAYVDDLECGEDIENVAHVHAEDDVNEANDQDSAFITREPCA